MSERDDVVLPQLRKVVLNGMENDGHEVHHHNYVNCDMTQISIK